MNLRHLTLHQLRIFQAVAAHNSFARAAEALHLSPPTLSLQVKQLANTVGQPLFEQLGEKDFSDFSGPNPRGCRNGHFKAGGPFSRRPLSLAGG